jgi:hypothetical protein
MNPRIQNEQMFRSVLRNLIVLRMQQFEKQVVDRHRLALPAPVRRRLRNAEFQALRINPWGRVARYTTHGTPK